MEQIIRLMRVDGEMGVCVEWTQERGFSTGGEEGLGEDGEDDDEEDEEYGGNVSQDGYKIMSDLENYGNYTAIVRQVIEGKSRQEE
jgi:hypothetical protein